MSQKERRAGPKHARQNALNHTVAPALKTPAQARAEFDRKGVAVAQWAQEHGFSRSLVYGVLNGTKKCFRGDSHKIAVLLGMKHGEVSNG